MKKNHKKKLIVIGILAVFYIIIVVNFYKIRFALSILRLYLQEKKIESPVNDNTNNKPTVDNPFKNIIDHVDNEDKSGNTGDKKGTNVDKVDTLNEQKKEPTNNDTKKSYISIVIEYNTMFEDLRSSFESDLDALIKQGIQEYSSDKISSTQLANKYLSIGADLEKSSDAKFHKVLNDMEKELKSNGYDTLIVNDIKNYYISFKDAKRTDLINRGMKHVK